MLFDAVFTDRLFGRPALFSDQPRSLARILDVDRMRGSGSALLGSEFVATFGLLVVIWGCSYGHPSATPYAVGAYITAAYWFTSSTSFANPAVTLAQAATDTFADIRPADAPAFIAAQLEGTLAASLMCATVTPDESGEGFTGRGWRG